MTFEHVASPVPQEAELEALWERAKELANETISPNWARTLRREEARYVEWCNVKGVPAVPTSLAMVLRYVGWLGDAGRVSMGPALLAITEAHHRAGFVSPVGPGRRPEALKGLLHAIRVASRDRGLGDRQTRLSRRRDGGRPG